MVVLLDKKLRKIIATFFIFLSFFLEKKYEVMLQLAVTFEK